MRHVIVNGTVIREDEQPVADALEQRPGKLAALVAVRTDSPTTAGRPSLRRAGSLGLMRPTALPSGSSTTA